MRRWISALLCSAALVACGGGDDSTDAGSAPAPVQGTTPDWNAACAGSPQIGPEINYFGVTPDGQVGLWNFDTRAGVSRYVIGSSHGSSSLRADAATCSYLGDNTGALRTSFLPSGVALSAAAIDGQLMPALLITDPQTSLAAIAGSYPLVRLMHLTLASGEPRLSGFGVFTIDASGAWSLCFDSAPGASCTPYTGISAARSDGSFEIVMDGQVHARLWVKGAGASRLLLMAIDNPFDPAVKIRGMWVGSSESTAALPEDGARYLTNDSGLRSHLELFSATDLKVDDGAPWPWTHDAPLPGYFSVAPEASSAGTGSIGLVSRLGVIALGRATAEGQAEMSFGVRSTMR